MAFWSFLLSLSVITYTYGIYPLILYILAKLSRSKKVDYSDAYLPYVSVIVAAYNEERVIKQKIENSKGLEYPKEKLQIIIGSDGSADGTDAICQQYLDDITFQRIEPRQGKPNVLNQLVHQAKGEILLFSDANTIFEPNSLMNIIRCFNDDSIGGVCGKLVLRSEGEGEEGLESVEKKYWNYEIILKQLESKIYSTLSSNGGIYAIRKKIYKELPVNTIIDDFVISLNVLEEGYRIVFEQNAIAYENISENAVDEFWRKVRIGSGNVQTYTKKPLIRNQKNVFTQFSYYSHKVIRWFIPFICINLYITIFYMWFTHTCIYLLPAAHFLLIISLLGICFNLKNKFVNLLSYFVLVNSALFIGYYNFFLGKHSVKWRKAAR